jgi:hypothetical protein
VIHREDIDQIITDHVEDGVGKAAVSCAPHTFVLDGVELRMALDPLEAGLDGTKKRLAESRRS